MTIAKKYQQHKIDSQLITIITTPLEDPTIISAYINPLAELIQSIFNSSNGLIIDKIHIL